jgi:hypothetical protein
MNHWRTWRARLAHLFDPDSECLCLRCAAERRLHAELTRAETLHAFLTQPRPRVARSENNNHA